MKTLTKNNLSFVNYVKKRSATDASTFVCKWKCDKMDLSISAILPKIFDVNSVVVFFEECSDRSISSFTHADLDISVSQLDLMFGYFVAKLKAQLC